MSVLIKGISKPDNCFDCDFTFDYDCMFQNEQRDSLKDQYEHCPLVEVPVPHGKLIDADMLKKEFGDINMDIYTDEAKEYIDDAPTVIEAEGEE